MNVGESGKSVLLADGPEFGLIAVISPCGLAIRVGFCWLGEASPEDCRHSWGAR